MKHSALIIVGACFGYFLGSELLSRTINQKLPNKLPESPIKQAAAPDDSQVRFRPWSYLQEGSIVDYVNNLRQIACPDETISDIIFSDLMRKNDVKISPALRMNLLALVARQQDAMSKMVVAGLPPYSLNPDYFLSPAELDQARKSLESYPITGDDSNAVPREAMLSQFNEEQMIYFKSEFEHFGPTVVRTLAGFRPRQDEYYAMISAMDKNSSQALLEKLPSILTSDRYNEFLAFQNPINIGVYKLCDSNPLLSSKAPQMVELLNLRTNLSVAEFRKKAVNLVGPGQFDEFVSIGQ